MTPTPYSRHLAHNRTLTHIKDLKTDNLNILCNFLLQSQKLVLPYIKSVRCWERIEIDYNLRYGAHNRTITHMKVLETQTTNNSDGFRPGWSQLWILSINSPACVKKLKNNYDLTTLRDRAHDRTIATYFKADNTNNLGCFRTSWRKLGFLFLHGVKSQ